MAKLEYTVREEFDSLLSRLVDGIIHGSFTATLEDGGDFYGSDVRCAVRVFERYSYTGSNRVSLTLTLFQQGQGPVKLCAITSGGSQGRFFKVNTWGEEAFLETLAELL